MQSDLSIPLEGAAKAKRKLFISMRWQLLIGFTVLFSVVFAIAFYWFYSFSTETALKKIEDDLLNTIKGAALTIDGDELVRLNQIAEPNEAGGSDHPLYISKLDWLETIHKIEPRAWPYLYIKGADNHEGIFLVDLQIRYHPDRAAPFKYAFQNPEKSVPGLDQLELNMNDNGVFDIYEDEFGQWVSAYAPIKNSAGENVGAMGIDFEAEYVNQVRQSILNKIFVAFILTYTGLFALVYLVTRALTQPIQKLTLAAALVGEGDYEQDFSRFTGSRVQDEMGKLAEVFTAMVEKVYKREQTLIRQVQELRIEIDESKKKSQVSEIVDTEFFKELQTRAELMRSRRRQPQD
jgi:hypothetical protein